MAPYLRDPIAWRNVVFGGQTRSPHRAAPVEIGMSQLLADDRRPTRRQLSILVVSPDPMLGGLIRATLVDDGHVVERRTRVAGVFEDLRASRPNLLILSVAPAHSSDAWRLLEQLYWDPSVDTRPIVIADPTLLSPDERTTLNCYATVLPLLFDLSELEAVVSATIETASMPVDSVL
jgi:hypothetical protein